MKALIWVEHDNAHVKDATLAVVTAASKLGEVTALVAGANCDGAAQAAAQIAGVGKVLKADDAAYANELAENVAPLVAALAKAVPRTVMTSLASLDRTVAMALPA